MKERERMNMSKVAFAAVLALLAAQAQAFWPFSSSKTQPGSVVLPPKIAQPQADRLATITPVSGSGTNAGIQYMRRPHLHFDDAKTEQEFLQYSGARRRVQEDRQVIARLIQEKKTEIDKFTSALTSEFSINPDGNYQYDDKTDTIYELIKKPSAVAATNGVADLEKDFDKKDHMKLDDKEKKDRFLRLVASKKLSGEELQVLQLLQNEKEIEASNIQDQLVARYAVSNDREYRYDKTDRTLYELIPLPQGATAGAVTDGTQEAVTK